MIEATRHRDLLGRMGGTPLRLLGLISLALGNFLMGSLVTVLLIAAGAEQPVAPPSPCLWRCAFQACSNVPTPDPGGAVAP
jgi:hypothetical protein